MIEVVRSSLLGEFRRVLTEAIAIQPLVFFFPESSHYFRAFLF